MIKIENVEVFGWEAAIRGMRNPMNSWDKSDSCWLPLNDVAGHPDFRGVVAAAGTGFAQGGRGVGHGRV